MHRFTIGFGGTKGDLFNRVKNALEEMSPIRGRINGNAERGQLYIPGQVPMSDEMLLVDYMVGDGLIEVAIRSPLPAFIADHVKSKMNELAPTGPFVPDHKPLPSSIPIERIPDLSKTYGKKKPERTRQLAVIEDETKPMLPKKVMVALAVVTAVGFGVYFTMANKEPQRAA